MILTDTNVDWNAELGAIRGELIRGEHAQAALALAAQQKIAAAHAQVRRSFVEGLGQLHMSIHPDIYWRFEKMRPGCWRDPEFRAAMARDNPELCVKSESRKTMLRMPGLKRSVGSVGSVG